MRVAEQGELAAVPVHRTEFEGTTVRSVLYGGRVAWPLADIEDALGEALDEITETGDRAPFAIAGEDYDTFRDADADTLSARLGAVRFDARATVVLLYEGGLVLASTLAPSGRRLREELLGAARRTLLGANRRARLEARILERVKLFELEDRARKARLLHRLIEHARRAGPLAGCDADYAEAMTIVAEVATGFAFPVSAPDDLRLAEELSVPVAHVTSALDALNDEKESP